MLFCMKIFFVGLVVCSQIAFAQTTSQKLDTAVKNLLKTNAASAANLSLYVCDTDGKLVYEYQGEKGLSTASTQKIFTGAAALETLGKNYQYTTSASYTGNLENGQVQGDLFIKSNGDPTLGSWRYDGYKPEDFNKQLLEAIKKAGITSIKGNIVIDDSYFDFQTTPGGWPWNDMGNYYGAGVWGVNWRENQFDLDMNGSKIIKSNIDLPNVEWVSEVKAEGNSDQSLIFIAPHSEVAFINGKLPAGKTMTVSGATPNPPLTLGSEIQNELQKNGISVSGTVQTYSGSLFNGKSINLNQNKTPILEYKSPTLDKIVYWFMRKSINLYGETFVKTMAKEKKDEGSFSAGIDYLKSFWKSKGINGNAINFADGSGLSPQNYVSAKAEVQALLYAKKQDWYSAFYEGFPTQGNGMKMKSGTMKDTKSFAGYYKNYTFAIIINNYQGGSISDALYQILNSLK